MKIIGYPTLPPPDWDSLRRRSKQLPPLATEAVEMAGAGKKLKIND